MLATPTQIDESIEKKEYSQAIKQIKTNLCFLEITEKSLKSLNTKLLKCLDLANFAIDEEISEIENIINEEIIFEKLSFEQKSDLYIALWNNFLKIWNFEEALINYNIWFFLWNKDIFKDIVFLNIFLSIKTDPNNIQIKAILSDIISSLDENKQTLEYASILENEILIFIFWEDFLPEDEGNVISEIYKLEAYEVSVIKRLVSQNKFSLEELNFIYYNLGQALENWYEDLWEDFSPELVEIPKENMIKRASWIDATYLYYWEYIKEFISFWFDIIEIYLKSDNNEDIEKSLFIIIFLTKYWFENLDLDKKEYLINLLINFLENNKNLSDLYINNLFNIIQVNFASWANLPYISFILMWEISLRIGYYNWSYQSFLEAKKAWFNIIPNIKNLLETMLFYKEFYHDNDFDLKFWKIKGRSILEVRKEEMDQEIIISILLEKINKWIVLNIQDYQTIEKLTLK